MKKHDQPFKTIAVATDMSEAGSAAVSYAQGISKTYASTLILMHVIDPLAYAFPEGAPGSLNANQAARAELSKLEEEARQHGIPVHSVLESGVVYERILQSVLDHDADLLILGTRGKTEAGRMALGTVARQLLARATCPILTVPAKSAAALPWTGGCQRVLVATDFQAASIEGLHYARQFAIKELFALHVVEHPEQQEISESQATLRTLLSEEVANAVPTHPVLAAGNAADVIAEFAGRFGVDLVVLGSPAEELSEEDFPSSTVLQVISKVPCPVLCVPAVTTRQEGAHSRLVEFVG
jgi:nucleotide-binding universal stress UspA family protein